MNIPNQAHPTLKYATQEHYKYVVNSPLLPAFGNVQLRLISRESIQLFLADKLKEGLSWRTVKHCRTTLGTILGTAEFWGYIEENSVRKTRLPRRGLQPEKTVLSPEQISRLLHRLPEPSRSIIWLLVLTGLRIGELLALHRRDVDLKAGLLRVSRTLYEGHFDEPKTDDSNRVVPLSAKGIEILSKLKTSGLHLDALVFSTKKGTPLLRRNLSKRHLAPVCRELGIPRIGWHSLRHSNATLLDAVGTPLGTVQSLLGHSSPEITRGIYIHSLPAGAKEAVQKVEDLLTGPKWTQIAENEDLGSPLIQ